MAVISSPINWIYFPASTVIVVSIFIGSLLSPLTHVRVHTGTYIHDMYVCVCYSSTPRVYTIMSTRVPWYVHRVHVLVRVPGTRVRTVLAGVPVPI